MFCCSFIEVELCCDNIVQRHEGYGEVGFFSCVVLDLIHFSQNSLLILFVLCSVFGRSISFFHHLYI